MTITDDSDTIAITSTLHHSLGVSILDKFFALEMIGPSTLYPSRWDRYMYRDTAYEPAVAERIGQWWCVNRSARDGAWTPAEVATRLWGDIFSGVANWMDFDDPAARETIARALIPLSVEAMKDVVEGHRVTIMEERPYSAPLHVGDVVRVARVDDRLLVVRRDDGVPWNVPWTAVNLSTVESDSEPATPTDGDAVVIESLRSDVQRLQNLLDEANAGHARYVERVRRDVDRLNEILAQKASENDFCSVWDETIDEVNGGNTYVLLKDREVDYAATRTVEIVVRVMQSGSYTGRENNDLDEDDFSWSDVETDDILAAVRRGDWRDPENDAEDFEYEEV